MVEKGVGAVELAVAVEVEQLSIAQERPTLPLCARAMARIIDDPELVELHAEAMGQLLAILRELYCGTSHLALVP
jgi:hypothetical protein